MENFIPTIDLANTESLWLSTRTPRELIAMIHTQTEWGEKAVRNLNAAMTVMIGTTLARNAPDFDELEDMQSLLRAAEQRLPAATPARELYIARWNSLSDCLRIRAELMAHGSYEAVNHMRHVPEIVQSVANASNGILELSVLQTRFNLEPDNLTRILNTLENHSVIVRESYGDKKCVTLGKNAPLSIAGVLALRGKTTEPLFKENIFHIRGVLVKLVPEELKKYVNEVTQLYIQYSELFSYPDGIAEKNLLDWFNLLLTESKKDIFLRGNYANIRIGRDDYSLGETREEICKNLRKLKKAWKDYITVTIVNDKKHKKENEIGVYFTVVSK